MLYYIYFARPTGVLDPKSSCPPVLRILRYMDLGSIGQPPPKLILSMIPVVLFEVLGPLLVLS